MVVACWYGEAQRWWFLVNTKWAMSEEGSHVQGRLERAQTELMNNSRLAKKQLELQERDGRPLHTTMKQNTGENIKSRRS